MSIICARCDRVGNGSEKHPPEGWEIHSSGMMEIRYAICPNCVGQSLGKSKKSGEASTTDDRLRLFIERIERLEEEKRGIADDIRDVYAEAKATGYDAKIMREIVRRLAMTPADRKERDALIETYSAALGIA